MRFSSRYWVFLVALVVGVIFFSVGSALVRKILYISKEEAIEYAKRECMREGSNMDPYNIEAEFLTWKKANNRLEHPDIGGDPGNTRTWLVSMDGSFLIYGPPPPDGSPNEPIDFPHCFIILDAKTGKAMRHTKTGD